MKKIVGPFVLLLSGLSTVCQVTVSHLLTENLPDPLCIDSRQPRLSWQLHSDDRNEQQTAYEISVSGQENGKSAIWNSGKVTSTGSVQVPYGGPELASGKRYYWRVRIWD